MTALMPILLALTQAAATVPLPDTLGPQSMPQQGCAAFLWSVADRKLVAVATASSGTLRLSLGGRVADLPRNATSGTTGFGFASTTSYAAQGVTATLTMTVSSQAELTDGGLVQQATLTLERPGADAVMIPVGGLVGCAPQR
ncbi:hypothetical protein GCM10011380_22330 [Sphingomonas metalli]|uniref:Uncharacterized protein n=1 Tax=Sphingomonas metalli TaxID=1779358 RepID=A0A916T5H2_9SPHN|nr:hypothetical protein [Sphingomonas metalli]GGB32457.1 hypothetical protein GCM10011380_22330 [Sphingomonas metalli]